MAKKTSNTSKTKNCSKGYACGSACINVKKNCRNTLNGQGKNYADWISKNAGDLTDEQKKAFTSRFKTLSKAPGGMPPELREQLRGGMAQGLGLSEGIEYGTTGTYRVYSFNVNGKGIRLRAKGSNTETEISFDVDGNYNIARGAFTKEEESMIGKRLAQIMRWEAATAPEGSRYSATAWIEDGAAPSTRRALAYVALGFSPPSVGFPGSPQYGVIRNGRLQPGNSNPSERQASIWREISNNPLIREESRNPDSDLVYRVSTATGAYATFTNSAGEQVRINLYPPQ